MEISRDEIRKFIQEYLEEKGLADLPSVLGKEHNLARKTHRPDIFATTDLSNFSKTLPVIGQVPVWNESLGLWVPGSYSYSHSHVQADIAGLRTTDGPSFASLHVPTDEFTATSGTWVPADGSGAGLSLTIWGTPRWVKLGKMVWVAAALTYPTTANASSNLISGLPYVCENNASMRASGSVSYQDLATDTSVLVTHSAQTIQIRNMVTANGYTNAALSGKTIYFSAIYMTA